MAAYAPAAVALPGDSPDVGEPGTGVGVSVVVPLYGRDPVSPTWLEAMERALRDQDAELLVVDNGPFPGVERLELSAPTRLVRCATPGAYAARNVGARHARGHWLVFTDADCLPQPGWLQALVGNASSADGLRAGAVQVRANGAPPNPWERYDVVRGIPQEHYVARGYAVTANLAMPAALLSALGGFDEQRFSGGDAELCRQAVAAGYPLVYVPEAVVEHPARDSWRALATKARRLKGGQLKVGPSRRRALWWLRTFLPPVLEWRRYLTRRDCPNWDRLVACMVQGGLWAVEMAEAVRLLLGGVPERR